MYSVTQIGFNETSQLNAEWHKKSGVKLNNGMTAKVIKRTDKPTVKCDFMPFGFDRNHNPLMADGYKLSLFGI